MKNDFNLWANCYLALPISIPGLDFYLAIVLVAVVVHMCTKRL